MAGTVGRAGYQNHLGWPVPAKCSPMNGLRGRLCLDPANTGSESLSARHPPVTYDTIRQGWERRCHMYDIPETGFLRLPQLLSVIPVGKSCWWKGVKSGRFPKPVKLSARCTAWRAEEIRALIERLSEQRPSA